VVLGARLNFFPFGATRYEDFQSSCRSETMCHYRVTTESIQPLRGRRKLELRGRFLEVFRVVQVRQHSQGRAQKTAYSIVFSINYQRYQRSETLLKAARAIRKTYGRHSKKILDGTPFRT
jgi:hypothetical protein